MTRQDLIDCYVGLLKEVGLMPHHMHVVAGGSMLLHGLREQTDDIDTTVNEAVYAKIKSKLPKWAMYEDPAHPSGLKVLSVGPFDIHCMPHCVDDVVVIDGVACQSLRDVLRLKEKLNRPKDQADIERIRKHLMGMKV